MEARIATKHPLRAMRRLANAALAELDDGVFGALRGVRAPVDPAGGLLRATLLQLLYSLRSERQLVERIEFDLLFRWFVGLSIDEKVLDASTFSKNRDRLLTQEVAQGFVFAARPAGGRGKGAFESAEHFSVDGTLLKAFASMKSFRPKSLSSGGDPRSG